MIRMIIGWILICYIIAFSLIIPIWFSETAHLDSIPSKIKNTFIILMIHIVISFLVLAVELMINVFIKDTIIAKSKSCIVKKYNPQNEATD
ncbi:MAG: hypothetical protein J6562_06035 [Candidatus Schmidhempelia sp.]|nr:hypothetical protein [Candidatus Schmidhempelia sp.]